MEAKRDLSLVWALIVAIIAMAGGGTLITWAVWCAPASAIAGGLTNVATIGGIVSGLSLSGTAVFALSGRYAERVTNRYGSAIRFVLFGGFTLVVTASILCGIAVVWQTEAWVRAVLGYSTALTVVTLLTTALLVNSAFAWRDDDANHPPRKRTLTFLTRTPEGPTAP